MIDQWKKVLWKSWTTRLAAALGVLVGVVGNHEIIAIGLLNFLPAGKAQLIGAGVVGFLVFALPLILARITKQEKLYDGSPENLHGNSEDG